MAEKNEFEQLEEDFPEAKTAEVPTGESSELIVGSGAGVVYDYNTAPDTVRAPPRIDLNGKETIIKKADIILPLDNSPWDFTKDKSKEYKYCVFKLYYDIQGQQEFMSGVRVFKQVDQKDGKTKMSHPSVPRDRVNQASALLGKYADFKKKDINEISLREFMSFLNSQPKVRLKTETVKNPNTGESIKKNMVDCFL